ncbi:uncharacterized protein L969DRAFT_70574 [Mixia osmundae IAM 14324]|uniref:Phosphatase activator n=1 Tax=Mixia osmundae (strain CBS 9802 / IAM 14324 / JCM 22182 / KY 12970) TaxID=764103 RepID=G7DXK2_MIXOS|nr:uncharacterized protein L969DRAFT_70574 [Mixia osmundae IAM 14324]KEI41193.1 hypothetical protein L969DRAFT_70574 [Mixia osmundae IAM 14324]GAA95312.1 hypothetical protein E5Q_01969 [Mixia osmundae IAM 14324]
MSDTSDQHGEASTSVAAREAGPPTRVHLDLRGTRLTVDREALMELPESVLLCLFPNGVVLNTQRQEGADGEEDEDVYFVDFDGACLRYILNLFDEARTNFYGPPGSKRRIQREQEDSSNASQSMSNPLFLKQAIIVLREELEFFLIAPNTTFATAPPSGKTQGLATVDDEGVPVKEVIDLKKRCGQHLLEQRAIFTALQRNVNRENNLAEQHLIDMLCMSGFNRDDSWGFRALEPDRCCITSLALVLLKTGITHKSATSPPGSPSQSCTPASQNMADVTVNAAQLATAQKLLLFWRKPARKCWWDLAHVELPLQANETPTTLRVWVRHQWTLETSLI